MRRLFTRFDRGDAAQRGDGTGFGLSIVESIMRLHRDKASAVSGTFGIRFSLVLPSESGSDSAPRTYLPAGAGGQRWRSDATVLQTMTEM